MVRKAQRGGITLIGPGVTARWSPNGGLVAGPYQHSDLFVPGRVRRVDGGMGWLETVRLAPDAWVYGGGGSFQGPNLRGRLRHGVNVETHGASGLDLAYINVPFYWSDAGWGLLIHTGAPVLADLGAGHSETAAFAVDDDHLDLFVFQGTPAEILGGYHAVTGLPGCFPAWALGIWTSRCSYWNAAEVEAIVSAYAEAGCPLDVVHIDAWDDGDLLKDLSCSWRTDRARWPDGWGRSLAERDVRISLWHNPYVATGTPLANELQVAGLVLADAAGRPTPTSDMPQRLIVDFTAPASRAWWYQIIGETVRAEGAAALKADFGEEIPPGAVCADGRNGWQIRNEYAVRFQQASHDALAAVLHTGEVALFCRSGSTGSQRFPCHWVGDTPSTWAGLITAIRACLSLSLTGFGLVATDIGGFWATSGDGGRSSMRELVTDRPTANVDPELYVRWTQFGAFSPVMRFHGIGMREPHTYPEPYRSAAIAACRLRARLRSYLVAAADEASSRGVPMLRPMALAYPGDRTARAADLQYLLGPSVLVAPVVAPGGRTVAWIPEGRWEPLLGLMPVDGPRWVELDGIPLSSFPAWAHVPPDQVLPEEALPGMG